MPRLPIKLNVHLIDYEFDTAGQSGVLEVTPEQARREAGNFPAGGAWCTCMTTVYCSLTTYARQAQDCSDHTVKQFLQTISCMQAAMQGTMGMHVAEVLVHSSREHKHYSMPVFVANQCCAFTACSQHFISVFLLCM